jgi:hypothetical protein
MVRIMHDEGNIPVVPVAPGEKDLELGRCSVAATDEMTTVQCDQQTNVSSLDDPTYENNKRGAPKAAMWTALRRKVILALLLLVGSIIGIVYLFESWAPHASHTKTVMQGNNATSQDENTEDMDIMLAPRPRPYPSMAPSTAETAAAATTTTTIDTDPISTSNATAATSATLDTDPTNTNTSNGQGCPDNGGDGNGQQSMARVGGGGGGWWSFHGGGGGVSAEEGLS